MPQNYICISLTNESAASYYTNQQGQFKSISLFPRYRTQKILNVTTSVAIQLHFPLASLQVLHLLLWKPVVQSSLKKQHEYLYSLEITQNV